MWYKTAKFLILTLSFLNNLSFGANLEQSIKNLIKTNGFSNSNFGIYVQATNKTSAQVSINPNKLFTPASVVKLATTYAALLELGKTYRWPTEFYINGKLTNGVLKGDLVVKAFGDPGLVSEDLDIITASIAKKGIKSITGNLIIDRSYFKVSNKNSARFDKNTHRPYNALPDAMMFNHRASKIEIKPNKKTGKIEALRDLPDSSYAILNQLKASKKSCRGNRAWPGVSFTTYQNKPAIKLSGTYSLKCPKREIYKVLTKPYYMFYHGLKFKLAEKGILLKGQLKLTKVPKTAKKIFILKSKPLIKIISKINKKSNNVMARQVLLTVGAKIFGSGATYNSGVKAVNSILKQNKVINSNLKIDNGSGLSRSAKLNALNLAKILQHAYKKYGSSWKNTLAVMGLDGTLKKRLRNSNLKGRAWMKTGSLKATRSIAGYLKAKSGKLYTVVILQNGKNAKYKGKNLQDEILKLVYASG